MKKPTQKIVLSCAMALLLSGAVAPSVVAFADNVQTPQTQTAVTPTGKEVLSSEVNPLEILMVNGVAYDSKGNIIVDNYGESYQRGKFSWAAKKLLKSYNSWPKWIKGLIGYGTANTIAKNLERANGTLINALTVAIEVVGFSPGLARSIASVLVNFIA